MVPYIGQYVSVSICITVMQPYTFTGLTNWNKKNYHSRVQWSPCLVGSMDHSHRPARIEIKVNQSCYISWFLIVIIRMNHFIVTNLNIFFYLHIVGCLFPLVFSFDGIASTLTAIIFLHYWVASFYITDSPLKWL